MDVGAHRPHQLRSVEVADGVLAPGGGDPQPVAPHRVEGEEAGPRRVRPLHRVGGAEGRVDDEPLAAPEVAVEGVALAAERVHVADGGPLRLRLPEHVGVAGVEALDGGALVAHRERRDQVVAHAEHEDVPVERRPVLLPDDHRVRRRGRRVGAAAGLEPLVVEDAVVLVGDLVEDDVLVLRLRHHDEVLERVVQVAAVVAVHVGRRADPAGRGHVRHPLELDRQLGRPAGRDLGRRGGGVELEALDHGQLHPPRRHLDGERAGVVEDVVAACAQPGVGVGGGVGLPVGGGQVDPRAGHLAGVGGAGADRQGAHGPPPPPLGDLDRAQCAAVGLEEGEPRQAALVGDERDPLVVGRPARMEGVVLEERQLVGLAPRRGLHVQVVELVGRPPRRRVDEAPPVAGDVGPGPVQRLLAQHRHRVDDAAGGGGHAQDVARAEGDVAVRHQQQLVALGALGSRGEPRRGQVHVPRAEVQPVGGVGVIGGDRHLVAGPPAVLDRPHRDVEVAVGAGRHVGDAVAVGRERRVRVDVAVVGQGPGLAGGHLQQLELHPVAVVVGGVDDPPAVGRPVGRRVVGVGAVGQLLGHPGVGVHPPDRPAHRHRDRLAVRRPARRPRGRARGGREVEVVHVVPAVARRGVAPRLGVRVDRGCRHRRGENTGEQGSSHGVPHCQPARRASRSTASPLR